MRTRSFERVLLAVDGSTQSRHAVDVVAGLAPAAAAVTVLHVWNLEVSDNRGRWDVDSRAGADQLVKRFASQLRAAGLRTSTLIRTAPASRTAREIVEAADDFGADLIAMGSRGRSDLGGLFLGSVSHEVLACTDRPVLIVRGALRHSTAVRRIVLALAGGDEVPSAVATAIGLAGSWNAEVLVLHVARIVAAEAVAWVAPDDHAKKAIDAAVKQLRDAGIDARGLVVTSGGSVANEIADVAGGWEADLIVMSSRRTGELRGLLTGASDHALVHRVETPVLIAQRSSNR